jgi:hypothetical protein
LIPIPFPPFPSLPLHANHEAQTLLLPFSASGPDADSLASSGVAESPSLEGRSVTRMLARLRPTGQVRAEETPADQNGLATTSQTTTASRSIGHRPCQRSRHSEGREPTRSARLIQRSPTMK